MFTIEWWMLNLCYSQSQQCSVWNKPVCVFVRSWDVLINSLMDCALSRCWMIYSPTPLRVNSSRKSVSTTVKEKQLSSIDLHWKTQTRARGTIISRRYQHLYQCDFKITMFLWNYLIYSWIKTTCSIYSRWVYNCLFCRSFVLVLFCIPLSYLIIFWISFNL